MISLIILEGLIRVVKPEFIPKDSAYYYEANSYLGWKYKKNIETYRRNPFYSEWVKININEDGFREIDFKKLKNTPVKKILFVGDSVTAALQVNKENRFSERLIKELQNNGQKFESINLGVNGFSTDQVLMILEKYIHVFNPEYIVYTYVSNDLEGNGENHLSFGNTLYGKPTYHKGKYVPPPFKSKYRNASKLANIKKHLRETLALYTILTSIKDYFTTKNRGRHFFDSFKVENLKKEDWDTLQDYLEKMSALSQKNNAKLIVIPNPPSILTNRSLLRRIEILTKSNLSPMLHYNKLKKICEIQDISFVKYTEKQIMNHITKHGQINWIKHNRLYDGHLTDSGHILFTTLIKNHLQKVASRMDTP